MCITQKQLVDSYKKGNPHERFTLIYDNYEVFISFVECYEIGLSNQILNEKEYNRRAKNKADLGVRVKVSKLSNPTADKGIDQEEIQRAIEQCDFSGDLLEDTDDAEKHRSDILTLRMMRREFGVFNSFLKALPKNEYKNTYRFIQKEIKLMDIANEENKTYQTVKNQMRNTKKTLEGSMIPFFRESI